MFQLNEEESVSTHQNYCHITVIQEHWRLAIFVFISKFLRPPVAKELHRVLCLIFEVERFKRKFFSIFSISSIIYFGTTDVRHKWTILDKANGFKTIILPSKVKFLMCHILKRFEYLILRLRIFFRANLTIAWKMNSEILDGLYFKVSTFYTTDCHLDPLQGPNSSNFTLRKVWLKTRILRIIRKYIWS